MYIGVGGGHFLANSRNSRASIRTMKVLAANKEHVLHATPRIPSNQGDL